MSPLEIDFERYRQRIAELEAEVQLKDRNRAALVAKAIAQEARAEKAEAEVERLRRVCDSQNLLIEVSKERDDG